MEMNMDKVVINGIEYVKTAVAHEGDDYVITRSRDQGVVCGYLKSMDPATRSCVLTEARQIWCWEGGLALQDIAKHGLRPGSRLSDAPPGEFVVMGACGVMRVANPEAMRSWPADEAGRK